MPGCPSSTTPLRLADAVTYGFPMGGMTVSGLRREIARGNLAVELIAGKQFTTLEAIGEMRRLCRAPAKRSVPLAGEGTPSIAQAALMAILKARKEESKRGRVTN